MKGNRRPKSDIYEIIGRKLKELRNANGFSQSQMASKLGISYQQVQKYEKGTNCPNVVRLFQIADVLKVDPIELIMPEGYKEKKKARKALQLDKDEDSILRLYRKLDRKPQKRAAIDLLQTIIYGFIDKKKYSG